MTYQQLIDNLRSKITAYEQEQMYRDEDKKHTEIVDLPTPSEVSKFLQSTYRVREDILYAIESDDIELMRQELSNQVLNDCSGILKLLL